MNDYQTTFVTPEQAVKAVQSGDWVDYGFGAGFPELLDRALAARKGEVKDVNSCVSSAKVFSRPYFSGRNTGS